MIKEIMYNFLIRVKNIIAHKLEMFLSDVIDKYGLTKAIGDYLKFMLFARSFISHAETIKNLSVYLFYKNIQKIHITIAVFFLAYIVIMVTGSIPPTAGIGGIELDQAGKVVEELVKLVPQEDMDQLAKKGQELFEQQEEPLKQEPPAATRGGFLIFCASAAGVFIAARFFFWLKLTLFYLTFWVLKNSERKN